MPPASAEPAHRLRCGRQQPDQGGAARLTPLRPMPYPPVGHPVTDLPFNRPRMAPWDAIRGRTLPSIGQSKGAPGVVRPAQGRPGERPNVRSTPRGADPKSEESSHHPTHRQGHCDPASCVLYGVEAPNRRMVLEGQRCGYRARLRRLSPRRSRLQAPAAWVAPQTPGPCAKGRRPGSASPCQQSLAGRVAARPIRYQSAGRDEPGQVRSVAAIAPIRQRAIPPIKGSSSPAVTSKRPVQPLERCGPSCHRVDGSLHRERVWPRP